MPNEQSPHTARAGPQPPVRGLAAQDFHVSVSWEPPGPPLGVELPAPSSSPAQLHVSLAVVPGAAGRSRAVAVASGDIDIATVGPLRAAAVAVAVAAGAAPRSGAPVPLLLDWRGVKFLDSSGVHLLHDLHAAGIAHGWSLGWIPPVAPGPARLLQFAAEQGWLPRRLTPEHN